VATSSDERPPRRTPAGGPVVGPSSPIAGRPSRGWCSWRSAPRRSSASRRSRGWSWVRPPFWTLSGSVTPRWDRPLTRWLDLGVYTGLLLVSGHRHARGVHGRRPCLLRHRLPGLRGPHGLARGSQPGSRYLEKAPRIRDCHPGGRETERQGGRCGLAASTGDLPRNPPPRLHSAPTFQHDVMLALSRPRHQDNRSFLRCQLPRPFGYFRK
jgi:hypothetical protein